jgi:site-specific DNA-methyltransferase (adenine-specific)
MKLNKIYQTDALEGLKELENQSVDLIIIDPPYSTPVITAFGRKKVKNLADLSIQEHFFKSLKIEFERVLKPNGRLFIFCDDKFYPILFAVFYDWLNIQLIIWDKGRIGMGRPIRKQHELIVYLNRESYNHNKNNQITHYPSILKFSHDKEKVHGAQKPIKLLEHLIFGFSNERDVVLDCFAGSGNTLLASKNLNRQFIGFDLNDKFCLEINRRLSEIGETQTLPNGNPNGEFNKDLTGGYTQQVASPKLPTATSLNNNIKLNTTTREEN